MTASALPEFPARRSSLEAYLLFWVAIELVVVVGGPAQFYSASLGTAITELVAILLPAWWLVHLRKLRWQEAWRVRAVPWSWVVCVLLLSAFGFPVVNAIHRAALPVVTRIFGPLQDVSGLTGYGAGFSSTNGLFRWLIVGALLPGICEEALFRGSILGVLERQGPTKAVIITALLFAFIHLDPRNFVGPLVLGLAFGFVAVRAQSIIPTMLWHASSNAMAYSLMANHGTLPPGLTLPSAIGLVASGGWFLHLTRDQERVPSALTLPALPGAAPGRRLAVAAGLVAAPVIAAMLVLMPMVFPNDKFAPEIPRGAVGVILRNHFGLLTARPGDWVSYRKEGKTYVRRVIRASPQTIWISDTKPDGQSVEQELGRSEITGKLIKHIGPFQ